MVRHTNFLVWVLLRHTALSLSIIAGILSSFFVAVGQAEQIKIITIEPFMQTENYEHFKRMVLNSSDSRAQYIEGFEFDWGYRYSLRVKQTTIGPLSDGTLYDYSLIETISKTKVADSTTFTMSVADADVRQRGHGALQAGLPR